MKKDEENKYSEIGFLVLYAILIGIFFIPAMVFADSMDFSVVAKIPENQTDKTKTYFDLRMKPGQEQTIEVEVGNNTDDKVTIDVSANTAVTNNNGVADYSQNSIDEFDESLKTPFSEIAQVEDPEITLEAKEKKVVKVRIKMPSDEYNGLILGGLNFTQKDEEEEESSGGVQIKNKFAYVIGVSLRENDTFVESNLELKDVQPNQVNYRNVVEATIQNSEAAPVKDLIVHAKVYTEKGNDILHETKKEGMKMVPNSNFNFPISWDNKEFKPGTYRLEVDAEADGTAYHWSKFFTINSDQSKELNQQAVELEKDSNTLLYVLIGLIVVLIILVLFLFLYFHRKKSK